MVNRLDIMVEVGSVVSQETPFYLILSLILQYTCVFHFELAFPINLHRYCNLLLPCARQGCLALVTCM
jgi:hypothetical protein